MQNIFASLDYWIIIIFFFFCLFPGVITFGKINNVKGDFAQILFLLWQWSKQLEAKQK